MKANKTFAHGAIYYVYDMSDGLYNRSYMGVAHDDTDFPELDEELWMYSDYGLYELTELGRDILDRWRDDVSCGYDLCYGRCKGIAKEIGATDWDMFYYLINNTEYTKRVDKY